MGVTIHYRGTLSDLELLPTIEDRLVDLALLLGGRARISRSASPGSRSVGGVIWDLAPGLETVSLLVSPEGWLVPLGGSQAALDGALEETPPWIHLKTQFGDPMAHVTLVNVLRILRDRWFPDLEVADESGYWETGDFGRVLAKRKLVAKGIERLTEAFESDGLSHEARESPEIVATRIERLAAIVHRTLTGPPEHPPVEISDAEHWHPEDSLGGTEEEWDAVYREQERKHERLHRAVEELRRANPELDAADALLEALEREGVILSADPEPAVPERAWEPAVSLDEPWSESTPFSFSEERHPLVQRAFDLVVSFRHDREPATSSQVGGHLLDVMGGLTQAFLPDLDSAGLRLVQLKRAYRGAAFALGGLHDLPCSKERQRIHRELTDLQVAMFDEMRRLSAILRERME